MSSRRAALLALFFLLSARAAAPAARMGIGSGNWHSEGPHRGVRIGLRITETRAVPRGVFCAYPGDGTTLAVPWGVNEPVPLSRVGDGLILVDALGAKFAFQRRGAGIVHRVFRDGKARQGHHTLVPSPTPACVLPAFPARAVAASHLLAGTWRGVYPDPEGPAVEISVAPPSGSAPEGRVCFANGNGSLVYWTSRSVRAAASPSGAVRWTRDPVAAALRHRTSYLLRAVGDDRALLTIRATHLRSIELRRGHSSRGCTAILSAE